MEKPVVNFYDIASWISGDARHFETKLNEFKHQVYRGWPKEDIPEAGKIKDAIEKLETAQRAFHEALLDNQSARTKAVLDTFKRISEAANNG